MISTLKNISQKHILLGTIFFIAIVLGPGISYGGLYLFHLVLIGLVLITSFNTNLRSRFLTSLKQPLNLILLVALIWYALSFLWAENKSYAMLGIVQFTMGILIVLFCQVFIESMKTFIYYKQNILLPVLLVVLGIALLEIYTDFRWPISSISYHNHWFGRENVIIENIKSERIPGYLYASPTVFFWNPNNLAVFLCLFIPFMMKNNWKYYVLFIVTIIVITQTSSRLSSISIFIMLFIFSILNFTKIRFLALYVVTLLLPMIFFGNSLLAIKANEPVSKLVGTDVRSEISTFDTITSEILDEDDNSQSIRKQLYIQGFQYIIESKLLGVGAGNAKWHNSKQSDKTNGVTSVHFYWLELVINGGIVLGLLMLFYFIKIMRELWLLRNNEISQTLLWTLILFGMAVISLSSAHYFLPYYAFLGFISAWINLNKQNHEKDIVAG
jgi:teichuronic acid biosynthesis protein TuaE